MIPRRMLEDIFASLPATLVTRLNVTADQATIMADNCLVSADAACEDGLTVWVYVSLPNTNVLSNYRLGYNGFVSGRLDKIQKLRQAERFGTFATMQWEAL